MSVNAFIPFGLARAIEPSLWVSTTECSCTKDKEVLDFCNRHGQPGRERRRTRSGAAPGKNVPGGKCLLDGHQLVLPRAQSDLLGMGDLGFPVRIGVDMCELVAVFEVDVPKDAPLIGDGFVDEVHACLVESYRVEAGGDADVGYNGRIVEVPAIALGADVHDEADVERRLAMQDGIDVFRDLLVERVVGALEHGTRGAIHADRDTLPASDTLRVVDDGLMVGVPSDRDLRAGTDAGTAGDALDDVDTRLGLRVHLHLPAPRTTAHADILERAAEAGLLMPLEVRERDNDVGVGNCSADLGSLATLEMDGNLAVVRALETVGDDDVRPDGDTVEAVLLGRLQMIDRVGAASCIQRIAVGQEGPAA